MVGARRAAWAAAMLALGALLPSGGAAQARTSSAAAQIILEADGAGSIVVVGEVVAFEPIKVDADLRVERHGTAGKVVTSQSRSLELAAGERATIAQLSVSFAVGDALTVSAVVRHEGTVISTATVSTGGQP